MLTVSRRQRMTPKSGAVLAFADPANNGHFERKENIKKVIARLARACKQTGRRAMSYPTTFRKLRLSRANLKPANGGALASRFLVSAST